MVITGNCLREKGGKKMMLKKGIRFYLLTALFFIKSVAGAFGVFNSLALALYMKDQIVDIRGLYLMVSLLGALVIYVITKKIEEYFIKN